MSKRCAREHLRAMLQLDEALYERILDTPGFAYHFNQLALLAEQAPEPGVTSEEPRPEAEKEISVFAPTEGRQALCMNCGRRKWDHILDGDHLDEHGGPQLRCLRVVGT